MKADRNTKYIQLPGMRADGGKGHYLSLTCYWKGYGFRIEIVDMDVDTEDCMGETVFSRFLRTNDCDYAANYARKVARNNFNAVIY